MATLRAALTRPRVVAAGALALGWVLMLAYAWPGIMTVDCFDHLREGRAGFYTDSHPPVVAVLWRYLDKLVTGPAGVYVLQTGLFVGGLFGVLRGTLSPVGAAIAAGAIALFPPVLAPMSVVWKDALMAGCLVVAIALVQAERRELRLVALAAVWLATAARYNAAAATLPIVVLLFAWRPPGAGWRGRLARYGVATGAWLAVTASAMLVNGALADRRMHFWASSNAVHDIVGTLAHVDEPLPDAALRAVFAGTDLRVDHDIHATLRARYKPTDFTHNVIGDARLWDLPIMGQTPAPAARREAITRAWRELVTGHPGAYVAHRLAVFGAVLGFGDKSPGLMVQLARRQDRLFAVPMQLDIQQHVFQRRAQEAVSQLALATPLFRGWLYLALALALAVLARRHRDLLAILASGVALELSLLPFAATPDFRYSHWLAVCTVLAGVLLAARVRRARVVTT